VGSGNISGAAADAVGDRLVVRTRREFEVKSPMGIPGRGWIVTNKWKARLAVALLAVIAGAGCNPFLLMGHLINSDDPKQKAEFPLKPRPKFEKEEVRVLVLTSTPPTDSPEMVGIDRLLAAEFIPLLEARCAENKEKVVVKKLKLVDDFKKETPNWRSMTPYEIGKQFHADYVIDIEVLNISIFEPRSNRQLMRGRAQVGVAAFDMSKTLPDPVFTTELPVVYPGAAEVSVNDEPYSTFRHKFVKHLATQLVIKFSAHSSGQKINLE
jgi:hypothetical protein